MVADGSGRKIDRHVLIRISCLVFVNNIRDSYLVKIIDLMFVNSNVKFKISGINCCYWKFFEFRNVEERNTTCACFIDGILNFDNNSFL